MKNLLNIFRNKPYLSLCTFLVVATFMYFVGFTYIYVLIAIAYIALIVPLPVIFSSLLARFVPSILIFFGLYQVAATLQLFLFSESNFLFAATLNTLLLLMLGYVTAPRVGRKRTLIRTKKLFSSNDIAGIVAVLLLVIPFLVFLQKGDMYQNIAQVGGIQAIDGANHWNQIYSNSYAESIKYDKGNYFPAGFHITTAFIQDSIGLNPNTTNEWRVNSVVFLSHYILMSSLLIYVAVYFVIALIKNKVSNLQKITVVFALVPSFCLFFIIPFIYNGFLNHIYMCAVVILAAHILIDRYGTVSKSDQGLIFAYYIVAYGAIMSWPLIAPPLILAPLMLAVMKEGVSWRFNSLFVKWMLPYALGTVLLAVPVLIQYFTSPIGPTSSILLEGGLKVWHIGIYAFAAIFAVWVASRNVFTDKVNIFAIYMFSFSLLIVGLAFMQYFAAGEVRYYTIKTSSFTEILVLLFFVFGLVSVFSKPKDVLSSVIVICSVPILMCLAISLNDNPLKEVRSMFRTYSQEDKPPFFEEDINALLGPGVQNKIDQSDYMTLHYQAESGKIYAHPQIPFWFSVMNKDMVNSDKASGCMRDVYKILLFGNYTDESQVRLRKTINKCALFVGHSGDIYTIVTDKTSYEAVNSIFSGNKNIRTVVK